MSAVTSCPTCGQTLPQTKIAGLPHLPPIQAHLLRILQSVGSQGITTNSLLVRLYPDGYPPTKDTVKSHVSRLRKDLRPCGYDIKSGWGYYKLFRIV